MQGCLSLPGPCIFAHNVQDDEQHQPTHHSSHEMAFRLMMAMVVVMGHAPDFLSETTDDLVLAHVRVFRRQLRRTKAGSL